MRILTATLIVFFTTVASAQSSDPRVTKPNSPVVKSNDLGRPGRDEFTLKPSFGFVSDSGNSVIGDQSGFGLDAQLYVIPVILKVGTKVYSDVTIYTFGFGALIPINNGSLTLNFDVNTISINSGTNYQQYTLRAVYDYQFVSGLRLGLGISRFTNSNNPFTDTLTAPTFGVGYKFGAKGPTLDLTYSTKDAILGSPDSSSSLNTSLKFTF